MLREFEKGLIQTSSIELPVVDGNPVQLPEGVMPFDATFARDGADLVLTDSNGQTLIISDFFTFPVSPDLIASNGAVLKGDLAARLAGSSLEAQFAQSGNLQALNAIGQVETLDGSAAVTRVDGSVVPLTVETKIFQNDLIETAADGKVSVVFADGTIFTLAEASRMVIDEFVYSVDGSDNKGGFNLITGGFVFIAGQVAKTGDMEVGTPTATMGIRGTTVQVQIGLFDGISKVTVALNQDPDGTTGRIDLFDLNGEFIATITATDTKWIISPIEGETRELDRTEDDFAADSILIADALAAYDSVIRRVQSGEEVVDFGDASSEDAPPPPEPENPNPLEDPQQNFDEDEGTTDTGDGDDTTDGAGGTIAPEEQGSGSTETETEEEIDNIRGDAAPDAQNIVVTGIEDDDTQNVEGQAAAESNDPEAELTFALETEPDNGTATVNPDGTFEYVPDPDFAGTDTFTYSVSDGEGNSDIGTVTVEIAGVNDAPVGGEVDVALPEDNAFLGSLVASDADDDPIAFSLANAPANGSVVVQDDGIFQYTPDADFEGTDTFTYQVTDTSGEQGTGTVTVTIERSEDVPEVNFELSVLEGSIPASETAPSAAFSIAAAEDDEGESAAGSILLYDPDTGETFTTTVDMQGDDAPVGTFTLSPAQAGAEFGEHVIAWTYEIGRDTYDALPEGFSATELYDVLIEDSTGRTDTVTITVEILGINDDPTAVDDSATTAEDTAITVNVLANDSDVDGNPITVLTFKDGANGTVTDLGNGELEYTPNADFNGTDTFTYTIDDGVAGETNGTATATVTVVVTAENDPPVAEPDAETTPEDTNIQINLLANDSDVEGDTLTVISVSNGSNGSVTQVGGIATYQPNQDFTGTDSFTYQVSDGQGGTSTGTVTVTVDPVNDAPVAVPDAVLTPEDTSVDIDVRANDFDVESPNLDLVSFTQPENGVVTENQDGTLNYAPDENFNGVDTFQYTVSDGEETATTTVSVSVEAENDAPVAGDDTASTTEDTPVTISVLSNDTDVDGPSQSVASVTQPANGTVTTLPSGQLQYTPAANFNGTDSFKYTLSDGIDTDTATVTVTVTAVNDAPVAVNDSATTDEDMSVTINVLGNDSDVDSTNLTASPKTQPANGSVTVDTNGNLVYTPDPNFDGEDTFTYTASDGDKATTATVTVTVNSTNDAPVAANDSAEVDEDGSVDIAVLGNDSDVDDDTLTIVDISTPSNGTAVAANGGIRYTPNANYSGPDSFTYTISDGNGEESTATVSVEVEAVNDPPTAVDDEGSTAEDMSFEIAVLANDSDDDGDSLQILEASNGTNGFTTIVGNNIRYTPALDFFGQDSFTYQVTDNNGGTSTATVSITVEETNDAPSAVDDVAEVDEDESIGIDVVANDTDVDSEELSVAGFGQGSNGSVTSGPNGTLIYTPNPDFNGADSFTYTVEDDDGLTNVATVTITINPVNDPPSMSDGQMSAMEDGQTEVLNLATLADDIDDNDTPASLQYDILQQPSNGSASISGTTLRFDPGSDFQDLGAGDTDTVTIKVRATDSASDTATATVTVTVTGKNDDPTMADGELIAVEDGSQVQLSLAALGDDPDSDDDGSTLNYAITSGPGNNEGNATITGTTLRYDPGSNFQSLAEGQTDTVEIDIRASDNANPAGTDNGTVTVRIFGKNDDPTLQNGTIDADEDGNIRSIRLDLLANDVDSDDNGATLNYTIIDGPGPGQGSAFISGTRLFYDPENDFQSLGEGETSTFDIKVRATDNADQPGVATGTFTVTVTGINDEPIANDDTIVTAEDTSVFINVLANDDDPDDDPLTITSFGTEVSDSGATVFRANNGQIIQSGGGLFYQPDDNFQGTDSFTYTISDGNPGSTDTATVSITVTSENDRPEFLEANPVTINLFEPTEIEAEDVSDTATVTFSDPDSGDRPTVSIAFDDIVWSRESGVLTQAQIDALSALPTVTPDEGNTNTGSADIAVSYTPEDLDFIAADETVTVNFTVTVEDELGATDTNTVSVVIGGANDDPVAFDDLVTVNEDASVTITVLSNDADLDGDALSITSFGVEEEGEGDLPVEELAGEPTNDGRVVQEGNSLIYTPNPDFTGSDSFTYTISDGNGGTASATVTIDVLPLNDDPVIDDDESTFDGTIDTLDEGEGEFEIFGFEAVEEVPEPSITRSGTIIFNDPDQSDTHTVDVVANEGEEGPEFLGNLTLGDISGSSGSYSFDWTYTISETDYQSLIESETYTYTYTVTVTDSANPSATDTATVTITLMGENDPPVAVDDEITVAEDGAFTLTGVLEDNDTDPDGDELTIGNFSAPSKGSISLESGEFVYRPDADETGSDSFTYKVGDGNGPLDTGSVSVTITASEDPPTAVDDSATTDEDVDIHIDVLNDDFDVDGDVVDIDSVDATSKLGASLSIDTVSGSKQILYEAAANVNGTDTFTYTISDGKGNTDTATVTIQVSAVDDPPVIGVGGFTVSEDSQNNNLTILDYISDVDDADADLTLSNVSVTGSGSASVVSDFDMGSDVIRYTPPADFNGTETISYTVSDGTTDVNGSVKVQVQAVNDAPDVSDSTETVAEDAQSTQFDVLDLNTDIDNTPQDLTITIVGTDQSGSASVVDASGTDAIVYTPVQDFVGEEKITYQVSDGDKTDTATITVTVTPVDDPLEVIGIERTVAEDSGSFTINFADGYIEKDGDAVTHGGPVGTVSFISTQFFNGNFSVTFATNPNAFGSTNFSFTANDGVNPTVNIPVTVNVTPVNDAPTAQNDTATTIESTSVDVDVLNNDFDLFDGDDVVLDSFDNTSSNGGTVSLVLQEGGDPLLRYAPAEGFTGTDTFSYQIKDVPIAGSGDAITATATVTITVDPENSAPTGNPDTFRVEENSVSTVLDVLDNDSDPDDDALSITDIGSGSAGAQLTNSSGSSIIYQPAQDFNGTETFTYTLSAGGDDVENILVTVKVDGLVDVAGDLATTDVDQGITIDVLANDSDPEGEGLQILTIGGAAASPTVMGTTAEGGDVVFVSGGDIKYTPPSGFVGVDTFTYTVSEDSSASIQTSPVTGTVTVVVNQDAAADFPEGIPASLAFNLTPDPGDEDPAPVASVSIEVEPISTQATTTGVNVLFAIDGSGSITLGPWNTIVAAVRDAVTGAGGLIEQFDDTGLTLDVGIIPFASGVASSGTNVPAIFRVLQEPDNGVQAVTTSAFTTYMDALVYPGGWTDWSAALNAAEDFLETGTVTSTVGPSPVAFNPTDEGGEPTDLNAMYFITDGNPQQDSGGWETLAGNNGTLEVNHNLDINPIAIGSNISQTNLKRLDTSIEGVIDGTPNANDPNDPDNPEFDLPTLNSASDLAGDLGASDLFNPVLNSLSVLLVRDGQSLGEVADQTILTSEPDGLSFEVALADIPNLPSLLGDTNTFIINAEFDTNPNSNEPGDLLQLSTQGTLSKAPGTQVLDGTSGNDLLLGSDSQDALNGKEGDDVILAFDGNDSVLGGDDDDAIIVNGTTAVVLSGGSGQDTVTLQTDSDFALNALSAMNIQQIETLNLTNGTGTDVTLTVQDIFDMSGGANTGLEALLIGGLSGLQGTGTSLSVLGDDTDNVTLEDVDNGGIPEQFSLVGTTGADANGNTYNVYRFDVDGVLSGIIGIDGDIDATVNPLPAS